MLSLGRTRPMSVGIVPIAGGAKKIIFPISQRRTSAVAQVRRRT